jgi:antitoxin component HigA of HigAB toxin-antitoxin module
MEIRPIKTEEDYRASLREIESLMGAVSNSPEGDRFDVLVTLVEAYERQHFPLDLPDPKMIWNLHTELGIPAECLIKQQRDNPRAA